MLTIPSRTARVATLAVLYVLLLAMLAAGAGWPAVVWAGLSLPLGFYCGWITHRDH